MTLYVSDPKMWEQAFKDLSNGNINPYAYYRRPQTGRGVGGRYSSTFHVPVKAPDKIVVPIKQITPVAAVAERAKTDLKREKRESIPHVDPKSINKRYKTKHSSRLQGVRKTRPLQKDVFDDEDIKIKKKRN